MNFDSLDHLVLTGCDIEASTNFNQPVLDMEAMIFGASRRAPAPGRQKVKLRPAAAPPKPHAAQPMPASTGSCLLTSTPWRQRRLLDKQA